MKRQQNKRKAATFHLVRYDSTLLEYLLENFKDKSRTTIKSYLSHRQIAVNGKTTTSFDFPIKQNDEICISPVGEPKQNPNHRIKIVFEDQDILVVEKKNGELSISTGKEGEITAYSIAMEHVRRQHPDNRVFVVHRLDRDTSGLLIFAKSPFVQQQMQNRWNENIITRKYIAIVEGRPEKDEDKLVSWLTENAKSLKVYASPTDNGGKKAITNYKIIQSNDKYSLLEITLETGRKNQIRAQFEQIKHPVAGDKKYGATTNPLGRLCLHASALIFKHPITNEIMTFDTGIPASFR